MSKSRGEALERAAAAPAQTSEAGGGAVLNGLTCRASVSTSRPAEAPQEPGASPSHDSEPADAPSVPPVAWVEINDDGAAVGATSSEAERDDLVREGWRIVEYVPRAALDAMRAERDEARAGLQKDCEAAHLEAYATGLAEAYEQAAKVCDSYANEVRWRDNALGAWECASRIRALGSKGGAK